VSPWEAQRWNLRGLLWEPCRCVCHQRGPLDVGERLDDRFHDDDGCGGWHRIRRLPGNWNDDGLGAPGVGAAGASRNQEGPLNKE